MERKGAWKSFINCLFNKFPFNSKSLFYIFYLNFGRLERISNISREYNSLCCIWTVNNVYISNIMERLGNIFKQCVRDNYSRDDLGAHINNNTNISMKQNKRHIGHLELPQHIYNQLRDNKCSFCKYRLCNLLFH